MSENPSSEKDTLETSQDRQLTTPSSDEFAEYLWQTYGRLTIDDVPSDVIEVAQQCILDWFGCVLAGSQEPLSKILADELGEISGPATIIGAPTPLRTTGILQAAMINGATGHALDFDDTHTGMGGHPTVPVLPAILALAEELGSSGAEVVAAFVVGLEVECRIGDMIGGGHYAKGWHKTSTIGVLGAAAAASRLLGLDEVQFGNAIGLAASNAAGLKANFGTMTKPYHAGNAAERGLLAARLAARGFTANHEAVSGNQSLAQAAGDGELRLNRMAGFRGRWLTNETLFKYHAACYLTHAGIEATTKVMAEHDLTNADVASIELVVHPSLVDVCNILYPTTGLEAKFSLRATQAFAVNGVDTTAVETYEDGPVNQPEVQKFLDQVTVETDESLTTTATTVTLTTVEGDQHRMSYDSGVPAADLDAQRSKLETKFIGLTTPVLGADQAASVMSRLADFVALKTVSVSELLSQG